MFGAITGWSGQFVWRDDKKTKHIVSNLGKFRHNNDSPIHPFTFKWISTPHTCVFSSLLTSCFHQMMVRRKTLLAISTIQNPASTLSEKKMPREKPASHRNPDAKSTHMNRLPSRPPPVSCTLSFSAADTSNTKKHALWGPRQKGVGWMQDSRGMYRRDDGW